MDNNPEKKKRSFLEMRKLEKPIYIFLFPLLFAGGYLAFRSRCEQYYHTDWPVWTVLLVFPLILLGIAAGYQLQFYLRKTIGEKAESVLNIVLSVICITALFAEYQYVLAPQAGLPPLTWQMLWEGLKRLFPFGKK